MSRNILKYSAVVASLLVTALVAGCGTSNKDGATLGSVAKVNEATCIGCHSTWAEKLTGEPIVAKYSASKHNLNLIGCQDCHGGGSQHNGVGPLPYPRPGSEQCKTCHTGVVDAFVASNHGPSSFTMEYAEDEAHRICSRCHTHEGAVLGGISGYTGDKDTLVANAAKAPGLDLDGSKSTTMKCVTCHTTHQTEELRVPKTVVNGAVVDFQPTIAVGGIVNSTNKQFNLCTSCHSYTTPTGELVASGTAPTKKFYHDTSWYRIIGTTHFDNPATSGVVEGYALRTNSENPCFDCHGHESKTNTRTGRDATIYTDWAKSAHGGKILFAKYTTAKMYPVTAKRGTAEYTTQGIAQVDAVLAAGAIKDPAAPNGAPGWVSYNWDASNRAACQRCHTATGAANFMKNPAGYSAANNDFSHLSGWNATDGSGQQEVLNCWGCHSNASKGELHSPGAITETYTAATAGDPATTVSYPNIGNSNVCMTCHLGREIGEVIKNNQDADGVRSFINSHYLTAGGTVFGKTGYTLGDRSYASPASFVHDKLGVSATGNAAADAYIASNGLSTSGPCAVCHLTSEKLGKKASHTFSPFTEYAASDVALNPVCVTCHNTRGAGSNAKSAWFEGTWKARSDAALEALKVQLDGKGMYFFNAHPYFYAAPYVAGGTNTAFTNWAGVFGLAEWKDAMGVAFNYNTLEHDPGAVAHNRYYTRRLIYDSIDKLDDGALNYSVFATLDALDAATATYKNDAITFLINRGTADANVGTAAERF